MDEKTLAAMEALVRAPERFSELGQEQQDLLLPLLKNQERFGEYWTEAFERVGSVDGVGGLDGVGFDGFDKLTVDKLSPGKNCAGGRNAENAEDAETRGGGDAESSEVVDGAEGLDGVDGLTSASGERNAEDAEHAEKGGAEGTTNQHVEHNGNCECTVLQAQSGRNLQIAKMINSKRERIRKRKQELKKMKKERQRQKKMQRAR